MTLNLGLYANTSFKGASFFCVQGPGRGMYVRTIGEALVEATTFDPPPKHKQLTPINLIKWSD